MGPLDDQEPSIMQGAESRRAIPDGLARRFLEYLDCVLVAPRRFVIETEFPSPSVAMLRGVWGAALHELDPQAYAQVFTGMGPANRRRPAYILRYADGKAPFRHFLDWILLDQAIVYESTLRRAWDIASGMGLGPNRTRFVLREIVPLGPDGTEACPSDRDRWAVSSATWPLANPPGKTPCRLSFPDGLNLRHQGRLVVNPMLPDLFVAATTRLGMFLTPDKERDLWALREESLDYVRSIPHRPWQGEKTSLTKYSASQRREVSFSAVAGYMDLPAGLGEIWPLLAAAQWLHLGKTTVLGMGRLKISQPS